MRGARRSSAIVACSLLPLACSSLSAQQDVPALIIDPTEETRAELLRVVRAALNDAPVTLAPDALTRDSLLTIERRRPDGLPDRAAIGRVLEMPEQFRLRMSGGRCVLVQQSNGKRIELAATRCRALESDR